MLNLNTHYQFMIKLREISVMCNDETHSRIRSGTDRTLFFFWGGGMQDNFLLTKYRG